MSKKTDEAPREIYLTADQVAETYSVSRSLIYKEARAMGGIYIASSLRIPKSGIEKYLAKQKEGKQ